MNDEPKYDEDIINFGYLKKIKNNLEEDTNIKISNKTRNFNIQPEPPYYIGDTWTQGINGDIYTCIKERLIGKYSADDWTQGGGKAAQEAKDIANSKSRTYLVKPDSYNTNDMWILENDEVHTPDKKGAILISITSSNVYNNSHWIKKDSYPTEDIINVINSNIAEANIDINNINFKVQKNETKINENTNEIVSTKSSLSETINTVNSITNTVKFIGGANLVINSVGLHGEDKYTITGTGYTLFGEVAELKSIVSSRIHDFCL